MRRAAWLWIALSCACSFGAGSVQAQPPAVDIGGAGKAFPPRRLVKAAKRFGSAGVLGSLCAEDYNTAVARVLRAAVDRL